MKGKQFKNKWLKLTKLTLPLRGEKKRTDRYVERKEKKLRLKMVI